MEVASSLIRFCPGSSAQSSSDVGGAVREAPLTPGSMSVVGGAVREAPLTPVAIGDDGGAVREAPLTPAAMTVEGGMCAGDGQVGSLSIQKSICGRASQDEAFDLMYGT